MKEKVFIRGIAIVAWIMLIVASVGCANTTDKESITIGDVNIRNVNVSAGNMAQYEATIDMVCCNNTLYYHVKNSAADTFVDGYRGKLCTAQEGTLRSVCAIDNLLAADDHYIYYLANDRVFAYHPQSDISTELTELNDLYYFTDYDFSSDGTLRILLDREKSSVLHIKDGKVVGTFTDDLLPNEFLLGEVVYGLRRDKYNYIYRNDENINQMFASYEVGNGRALHSVNNGLLFVNGGLGEICYYTDSTGEFKLLFPKFECAVSESAVNYYGDYVFLSLKRYEGYGGTLGKELTRFENDELEGTYRIDLKDLSVTKISDEIYNGLFIFDDAGIFTSSENGEVTRIDFDGKLITTILGDA